MDKALDAIELLARDQGRQAWAILCAHHLARNIYPKDPFIPNNNQLSASKRLLKVAGEILELIEISERLGSYHNDAKDNSEDLDVKDITASVYGPLWEAMSAPAIVKEASMLLNARLRLNGFKPEDLIYGRVLDAGCGSGRFTLAMASYAESVVGIDFGDQGLQVGKTLLRELDVKTANISFEKGDLLDLPYPSDCFDFVLSNGTAHHTTNPKLAVNEAIRVAKVGGHIFLYLYGSGGIFWHTRKRLNKIMKHIPKQKTRSLLQILGMPNNRFIFEDNWYVPIEEHLHPLEVESWLEEAQVSEFALLSNVIDTDIPCSYPEEDVIWGTGELRYLIKK